MQTFKTNNYGSMVSTGADLLDRTADFIDRVRESKVAKVLGYAIGAVAGLFILGGVLRILAWSTIGWNQFASALKGK